MEHHRAGLSAGDTALLDFALQLTRHASSVSLHEIIALRAHGFTDESVLEAILTTALASFLCTLSAGLGPAPDFEPGEIPLAGESPPPNGSSNDAGNSGPYLRVLEYSPDSFPPFAFFRERFGFIPNIFRAQTLRPDVLEAEAGVIQNVLLTEDVLTRVQKERILLVISAANLNSYCVAVHCELLRGLGISPEESDQIAVDHHQSNLSPADQTLLDFALKLAVCPAEFGREDIDRLRGCGFTDQQILESVVMSALTNFLNTLQMGLGTTPDFEPRLTFAAKTMYLSPAAPRPITVQAPEDPDADLVARAQGGSLEAFEELIRRHSRPVFRILVAILGDPEEAKDAMQDTFLNVFRHLGDFEGRSKFSTWLVSIARNSAVQYLRKRKDMDSLDETSWEGEEAVLPRQLPAWQKNPEQMYSAAETRELVEQGIRKLPAMYRLVVMLRDIEQLPTAEVAQQLGLSIPALKARLLRGRSMLRDVLSAHFAVRVRTSVS